MKLTRRDVLAAGSGLALSSSALSIPTFLPTKAKAVVVASGNGHQFRNGGDHTCIEEAFQRMTSGTDILESLIAGVNIVELDPKDTSVGYGGVPNADGVVQLDSCCMHGAKNWAGGVAGLEGVRTPASVAYKVASQTDHHLLVGAGAQAFAKTMGFEIEDDLNTETSRRIWLEWKRRIDSEHYLDPTKRELEPPIFAMHQARQSMIDDGILDPIHAYGTINCCGMNEEGEIAGVTTTSGLAFKIPGRVGDSPILGAGLYVDGKVGAAGSTGRGEANLFSCASFLIVEEMRRGAHPKDAVFMAMKRIKQNTKEKRLLNDKGLPNFGMEYYALDAKGRHCSISTNPDAKYAVRDEGGARMEKSEYAWN